MTETEQKAAYEAKRAAEQLLGNCNCKHAYLSTSKVLQASVKCSLTRRYTDPLFCCVCECREEASHDPR